MSPLPAVRRSLRWIALGILVLLAPVASHAQLESPAANRALAPTRTAASILATASEQFAKERQRIEADAKLLQHLYKAQDALMDAMQPATAIQRASEQITEAERIGSAELPVRDGLVRIRQRVEEAKKSPGVADFDQLRSQLREVAIVPASRVVARNTFRLQQETLGWIKLQELIAAHLRTLAEASDASLRASQH